MIIESGGSRIIANIIHDKVYVSQTTDGAGVTMALSREQAMEYAGGLIAMARKIRSAEPEPK